MMGASVDTTSSHSEVLADRRFHRNALFLCKLGPRAVIELLAELGAEFSIMTPIEQKLARYAELEPAVLEALGGRQLPPVPLQVIDGSREATGGGLATSKACVSVVPGQPRSRQ